MVLKDSSIEMVKLHDIIYENRCEIAELKRDKIEKRAEAWKDATGIADEKKDYVRSQVAEIDESIAFCEARIELAYNNLKTLEWELINE